MSRLRFAPALTAALVLGLSLTACDGKDGTASAGNVDGGSRTGAPAATSPLTQANFADRVFKALEKAGSAKVHFESGAGGQTVKGNGEIKYGDPMSLRVTMETPKGATGAPSEMLMVGNTFYIGMGDKYMTLPIDAFKSMGVPDLSANLDPRIQAKAFKSAVTKFDKSGDPETIDGVQATPYTVTIDPKKSPDVFGTMIKDPITTVYYIGPDDLLRKMVYKDKNGEFISTYSDWGVPVTIEAPPASKLMQGMNGGMPTP
jgi:hypothetical protein